MLPQLFLSVNNIKQFPSGASPVPLRLVGADCSVSCCLQCDPIPQFLLLHFFYVSAFFPGMMWYYFGTNPRFGHSCIIVACLLLISVGVPPCHWCSCSLVVFWSTRLIMFFFCLLCRFAASPSFSVDASPWCSLFLCIFFPLKIRLPYINPSLFLADSQESRQYSFPSSFSRHSAYSKSCSNSYLPHVVGSTSACLLFCVVYLNFSFEHLQSSPELSCASASPRFFLFSRFLRIAVLFFSLS